MNYMAPLQGFTDYVYRKVYEKYFHGVDAYFIPYISLKNGKILKKHHREILPANNKQKNVVPQVLVKDGEELMVLYSILKEHGYQELNINLGCPYPMVTNRGKGSGLLPNPEKIDSILNDCLPKIEMNVSVKLRSGLENEDDIKKVIQVLNQYPLKEVIYHPRIAKQLYKGKVNHNLFEEISEIAKNELVFNGDINSLSDYNELKTRFHKTTNWMLGRGILMDPFLPEKIVLQTEEIPQKHERLMDFHNQIVDSYKTILEGDGQVLMKLNQFWSYQSHSFSNPHKVFKLVKKAKNMKKYQEAVRVIFNDFFE